MKKKRFLCLMHSLRYAALQGSGYFQTLDWGLHERAPGFRSGFLNCRHLSMRLIDRLESEPTKTGRGVVSHGSRQPRPHS
jgi:hypothetical protein